jgi:hypothetical protein
MYDTAVYPFTLFSNSIINHCHCHFTINNQIKCRHG